MILQRWWLSSWIRAECTFVWFFPSVNSNMFYHIASVFHDSFAVGTSMPSRTKINWIILQKVRKSLPGWDINENDQFWVYSRNVESRKIILKNQLRISVFYKLFGVFSNLNSVQIYKSSLHLYICKVCHQYVFEYVLSYRFCLSSYDYKMGNHAYFYTQNRIQLDQSADFGAFEYIQSRNSRLRQS